MDYFYRMLKRFGGLDPTPIRSPDEYEVSHPYFYLPGAWAHTEEAKTAIKTLPTALEASTAGEKKPNKGSKGAPKTQDTPKKGTKRSSKTQKTLPKNKKRARQSSTPESVSSEDFEVFDDESGGEDDAPASPPTPPTETRTRSGRLVSKPQKLAETMTPARKTLEFSFKGASKSAPKNSKPACEPAALKLVVPEPSMEKASGSITDSEITSLISRLTAAYADATMEMSSRLNPAKDLAKALLELVFPASQGFSLRWTTFPTATFGYGWQIECKGLNEYRSPNMHTVPANRIGGFLVEKAVPGTDDSSLRTAGPSTATVNDAPTEKVIHTALAIFADDMATQDAWAITSPTKIADIIAFDLGTVANIDLTTVFTLMRDELQIWTWDGKAQENVMMKPFKSVDPSIASYGGKHKLTVEGTGWEWQLKLVERVVKDIFKQPVTYGNGYVGEGVSYD